MNLNFLIACGSIKIFSFKNNKGFTKLKHKFVIQKRLQSNNACDCCEFKNQNGKIKAILLKFKNHLVLLRQQ